MRCDAVKFGRGVAAFRGNLWPPSSGQKRPQEGETRRVKVTAGSCCWHAASWQPPPASSRCISRPRPRPLAAPICQHCTSLRDIAHGSRAFGMGKLSQHKVKAISCWGLRLRLQLWKVWTQRRISIVLRKLWRRISKAHQSFTPPYATSIYCFHFPLFTQHVSAYP
jgi:hypothetical protein